MAKVTEVTAALARPLVEAKGCVLWDVEYVRQAGSWYLRVYIDKEDGVTIQDCEDVSRELSDLLDEADPIPDSYIFEVSSAGAERALKLPWHFAAMRGRVVSVKLYRPREGQKSFVGELLSEEAGAVTLRVGEETMTFSREEVAAVHLVFSDEAPR